MPAAVPISMKPDLDTQGAESMTPPGTIPPGLMAAALLFWGWHTGLLLLAIPLALLLEGSRWSPRRWDFSESEYQRVWNGCLLLLLAAVVFAIGYQQPLADSMDTPTEPSGVLAQPIPTTTRWAMLFFQWQPLVFAPFVLIYLYGRTAALPLTVFSWLARRQHQQVPERLRSPSRKMLIAPLYTALVIISASTVNRRSLVFILISLTLIAWTLWRVRSQRLPIWAWILTVSCVGILGLSTQRGILQIQRILMGLDQTLFQRAGSRGFDPKESQTLFGSVGKLKLSGSIVMRVFSPKESPPDLLREVAYNTFERDVWKVAGRLGAPRALGSDESGTKWFLVSNRAASEEVTIAKSLSDNRGILPLPMGSAVIHDLPAQRVTRSTNINAVVKVEVGPSFAMYSPQYRSMSTLDEPPNEILDTQLPLAERAELKAIAEKLNLRALAEKNTTEVQRALYSHFRTQYRYSLDLEPPLYPTNRPSFVLDFLVRRKEGHCEYFATATTLLLRAAGIPTRYAVGYSVQESAGPGTYVVRERHAHAWCLVWSREDRTWRDFDTTPVAWNQIDSERKSMWEPFNDFLSRIWFEFSRWRAGRSELTRYLTIALVLLLLVMVARLFFLKRFGSNSLRNTRTGTSFPQPGLDSEFYQLETLLRRKGYPRLPGETPQRWIQRLSQARVIDPQNPALQQLIDWHYQLRFGSTPLQEDQRNQLREMVRTWRS